jgi:hypothetical protein
MARVGNGAGWGGPAKGSPDRGEMQAPFVRGNKIAMGYHDFTRNERREKLRERLFDIAMGTAADSTPTNSIAASVAYMNRDEGMPRQAMEMSGPDGAPLATGITVTFVKPTAE